METGSTVSVRESAGASAQGRGGGELKRAVKVVVAAAEARQERAGVKLSRPVV